jgi:heme-degrading monooxygenase HmoA
MDKNVIRFEQNREVYLMIRVMIERHCQPGKEAQLRGLLIELRSAAMKQSGYISGETLRELDDPSLFIIISTWITVESWRVWQTSRQRLLIEDMMDSLLTSQRKVRTFVVDYEN